MKRCSWCDVEFEARRGQLYCSEICKSRSTSESTERRKLAARIKRRQKTKPVCAVCGVELSIYGTGKTCSKCVHPRELKQFALMVRNRV